MNYKHNPNLTNYAKELRKNMTEEEKLLWYGFLKDYPVRFLRQKVIDNFIVDFYCSKAKLAIELDGSEHYTHEGLEHDKIRTDFIESRKIKIIRITNKEIKQNFENICKYIDEEVKKVDRIPSP